MMKMMRRELLSLCGSIEQVAGVREIEYRDGSAAGLKCLLVKSGPLEFALMANRCLDMAYLTYRGINLSYLAKPGLLGPGTCDTAGAEGVRSIMGGAMFTCGLDHVHGYRKIGLEEYPTHGRIRNIPAQKVGMDAFFDGEDYKIRVTGEMRQGKIFGENLVMRRTVETVYGTNEITVRDEIENQSFVPEPLCFLYHCNAGYPLLTPGSRLILPDTLCTPRDEAARSGMALREQMEEPKAGREEQVFMHVPASDEEGNTFGAFVNDELKLALVIQWNTRQIPYALQWKSTAAGDYAMAVEPTNAGFDGRAGQTQILGPFEKQVNELKFCVLEGKEEIDRLESRRNRLTNRIDNTTK